MSNNKQPITPPITPIISPITPPIVPPIIPPITPPTNNKKSTTSGFLCKLPSWSQAVIIVLCVFFTVIIVNYIIMKIGSQVNKHIIQKIPESVRKAKDIEQLLDSEKFMYAQYMLKNAPKNVWNKIKGAFMRKGTGTSTVSTELLDL